MEYQWSPFVFSFFVKTWKRKMKGGEREREREKERERERERETESKTIHQWAYWKNAIQPDLFLTNRRVLHLQIYKNLD